MGLATDVQRSPEPGDDNFKTEDNAALNTETAAITGIPFVVLMASLVLSTWLVALNATFIGTSGTTFIALYWMPVSFQAIKQASPFQSGVWILPMSVSQLLASIVCGALVQWTGYYLPEAVFGNLSMAVGAGLFSTMSPTTTTAQWIGYQILVGIARGFTVTAMQANSPKQDASEAIGNVMFFQWFGGAILTCAAKTVFASSTSSSLADAAPSIDPSTIIHSGTTKLKAIVPPIMQYLQLATACCAVVTGFGMGWKSLKSFQH
ncbi:hypothetical protein CDD80_508 [Ophiocordyceps camponoti-rufipedis]|uniref:Major facilitator superfamily (MFS) profile domain-containing protein n=1 Tax=Ophiocordyceps camponoti-rufipedis TaxID=2004952 RepID=A0A2C5ZEC0_9HYPO|nr:hypothetical protein CDD80_508 [Ophiocordyceps camponoti-rufipedis]